MVLTPKPPAVSVRDERAAYELVTLRDGGRCVRCGMSGVMQRDHRQNRQAGNTVVSNLQLLCVSCHEWKTQHPAQALAAGFAVPRWAVPWEWPAARWVRDDASGVFYRWFVLYTDAGDVCRVSASVAVELSGGVIEVELNGSRS